MAVPAPSRTTSELLRCRPGKLRNWPISHRKANGGTEANLMVPERARLKELGRSAHFAQEQWRQ